MLLGQKGFTFVEILIAGLILATISVGLMSAMQNVAQTRPLQARQSSGYNVARQTIEQMNEGVRADWWENAAPGGVVSLNDGTINTNAPFPDSSMGNYDSIRTVTSVNDGGGNRKYKRGSVRIQWP